MSSAGSRADRAAGGAAGRGAGGKGGGAGPGVPPPLLRIVSLRCGSLARLLDDGGHDDVASLLAAVGDPTCLLLQSTQLGAAPALAPRFHPAGFDAWLCHRRKGNDVDGTGTAAYCRSGWAAGGDEGFGRSPTDRAAGSAVSLDLGGLLVVAFCVPPTVGSAAEFLAVLVQQVQTLAGAGRRVLLAGDLGFPLARCDTSGWVEDDGFKEARKLLRELEREPGMLDLYRAAHQTSPGYTAPLNSHGPSERKGRRTSVFYATKDVLPWLVSCEVMGPVAGCAARPLLLELRAPAGTFRTDNPTPATAWAVAKARAMGRVDPRPQREVVSEQLSKVMGMAKEMAGLPSSTESSVPAGQVTAVDQDAPQARTSRKRGRESSQEVSQEPAAEPRTRQAGAKPAPPPPHPPSPDPPPLRPTRIPSRSSARLAATQHASQDTPPPIVLPLDLASQSPATRPMRTPSSRGSSPARLLSSPEDSPDLFDAVRPQRRGGKAAHGKPPTPMPPASAEPEVSASWDPFDAVREPFRSGAARPAAPSNPKLRSPELPKPALKAPKPPSPPTPRAARGKPSQARKTDAELAPDSNPGDSLTHAARVPTPPRRGTPKPGHSLKPHARLPVPSDGFTPAPLLPNFPSSPHEDISDGGTDPSPPSTPSTGGTPSPKRRRPAVTFAERDETRVFGDTAYSSGGHALPKPALPETEAERARRIRHADNMSMLANNPARALKKRGPVAIPEEVRNRPPPPVPEGWDRTSKYLEMLNEGKGRGTKGKAAVPLPPPPGAEPPPKRARTDKKHPWGPGRVIGGEAEDPISDGSPFLPRPARGKQQQPPPPRREPSPDSQDEHDPVASWTERRDRMAAAGAARMRYAEMPGDDGRAVERVEGPGARIPVKPGDVIEMVYCDGDEERAVQVLHQMFGINGVVKGA